MTRGFAIRLVIGLAITLFAIPARSQDEGPRVRRGGGVVLFISGGAVAADIGALNDRFRAAGYAPVNDRLFSTGGGGHIILGRLVLGGEGQMLFARETTSGARTARLDGGYGLWDVGLEVLRARRMQMSALAGVGHGRMTLRIAEKGSLPFDSVLVNPRREARLSTSGVVLRAGIAAHVLVPLVGGVRERGSAGSLVGIHAGWVWFPGHKWKLAGRTLTDRPDAGFPGPYVRLSFGFGGWTRPLPANEFE